MWVSAASLLTAIAVASLFEGGAAAAPKLFMGVEDTAALRAEVEHAEGRHVNAPDRRLRRGELRKTVSLSILLMGLSSLAVVCLVMQCTRSLSQLGSAPVGQQRLLAEGGADRLCGGDAPGGEAPGGEETAPQTQVSPTALDERVAHQAELLLVSEEDRLLLSEEDLAAIGAAAKALQDAQQRVGAVRERLLTVEQHLKNLHQSVSDSELTPPVTVLTTIGMLEEKKQAYQRRYDLELSLLSSMAYQTSQKRRAVLKLAGAHASGRPISERLASTLAACERVQHPGKVFPDLPSPSESVALLEMSNTLREDLERLASLIFGAAEGSEGLRLQALRKAAETKVSEAERFQDQLWSMGMSQTAAAVLGSADTLRDALSKTPAQPLGPLPPLASLEESLAELTLSEGTQATAEEIRDEMEKVKRDELALLATSKAADKIVSAWATYDQGWVQLHAKFADLALTLIVSGSRTVSSNVSEDARNAYGMARSMCESSLKRLALKLKPYWLRRTRRVEAPLREALEILSSAEVELAGKFPESDRESPLVFRVRECSERIDSALKWHEELNALVEGHPFVAYFVGGDVQHLRSIVSAAQESLVRAAEQHVKVLSSMTEDELARIESFPPGHLPFTDGLRIQRVLQVAVKDIEQLKRVAKQRTPSSIMSLEAKLAALKSAFEKQLEAPQCSAGSMRKKGKAVDPQVLLLSRTMETENGQRTSVWQSV
ncbi:hypothetical protein Esti_004481 [Eimeria stiedai]